MTHQARHEMPGRMQLDQERVSGLLARYPDVSGDEAHAILTFLQTGRYFDVGLLTSNARLKPNLDAFLRDHRGHFEAVPGRAEAIVGVVTLSLFIFWAIWTAVS